MKNNYFKVVSASILMLVFAVGCSDVIEPVYIGNEEDVDIWADYKYAHGVLDKVYDWINDNEYSLYGIQDDYLSDNAVQNNDVTRFATGGASSSYYPIGKWDFHYRSIININQYLEYGLEIPIKIDTIPTKLVPEKLFRYGEAHFLRAWSESELLKQYAGPTDAAKTEMLGIPLLRKVYTTEEIREIPRSTYQTCVEAIISDLDTAIKYCPFIYDGSTALTALQFKGRATQRAALALKSRLLLFAASPAYNTTNDVTKWESAATAAYDAIMMDGSLLDLGSIDDENKEEHIDVIWKALLVRNNDMENDHFPPSFYGSGRCNPSQNLVDAFPMADGTPIFSPIFTSYDSTYPYENRDERFGKWIVYNGEFLNGYKAVQTYIGGADTKGVLRNDATRTGYYMERFTVDAITDSDPRAKDGSNLNGERFVRLLDKEEIYLNFAEAANEAGSDPTIALPGMSFSAYDVFQKVRQRGGATSLLYTDYLVRTGQLTKEVFRDLVKNERRIEFAFRGFRYWDLRRWLEPLSVINEPVKGISILRDISLGVELFEYNEIIVETRRYLDNTYYGPLPYDEVYKSEVLKQNYGWQ